MSQPEKSIQRFVHRQEKKNEDSVTVTIKLVCGKNIDIVAAAGYSENFCESDQSAYQEHQRSLMILMTQFYRFIS